jgi:ABC-type antimicrobial peptide transport system permease subunit
MPPRLESTFSAFVLAVVTLSVLLLSAAGMYALMSFSVNQRRREIGLRSALGAQPLQLLAGIFRRPIRQVAAGAAVGLLAAYLAGGVIPIEDLGGRQVPGVLLVAALFILVVSAFAVAGPARRALRLAPTEALREGG